MTARLLRSAVVFYLAASLAVGSPVFGQSQSQDQPQAQSQPQTQSQPPVEAQAQSQPSQPPAQDQSRNFTVQLGPDYSKGKRAFPTLLAPYVTYHVPEPVLTNSPRIDQLIHDGKLMLSLQDAVSLALENNLDITVQRYVPWIAQTDILRTQAGGAPRGASGFGTAFILGSIPQTTFDPVVTANYSWNRAHFPVNNPLTSGTGTTQNLTTYNEQANFQYTQGFHTGTAIAYAIDNTRTSSTVSPSVVRFNPDVQSTQIFQIQQQLLNGFGLLPNTRFILEAKNNMVVANATFALQVITTVTAVENLYWEVVFARENVKVQEAAVATSQKLYEDNKKQVEIGTLAPIEVVRAESEVAADRQNLIVAQTNSLQQQTLLLNAIAKNPLSPELLNVEVIPTDAIPDTSSVQMLPLQDAVKVAWEKRLEIRQQQYTLKNDDIEVKTTRNALLPTLTAFGQYSSTGLAGDNCISPTPCTTPPFVFKRSGLSDALGTAYSTDFPQYSAGVNFTLPIRNRSAQADNARALLTQRQDETIYKRLQNGIMVDVRNTEIALQQDMARVEAAQKARELAQQTLDAERKKYQLGASTVFFVIQAQRDLTTAQGNELRAKADLQEAEVGYYRSLGRTLEVNNITVADARSGHVYHPPLIPGTPSAQLTLTNEGGK